MNPAPGLLRSIIEEPSDDAPRLVISDWLDEHGQPERAEFIRAQVALSRSKQDSPGRRELAYRARALLDEHEQHWVKELPAVIHDWRFRRGFVEMVGLMGDDLANSAAELFSAIPLRHLWVTEPDLDLECLLSIPTGNRLLGLDLCGNQLDYLSLRDIARLTNLPELKTLGLMFNRINDQGVELLYKHPFFQRLSLIRCGANPFSEDGRQRLVEHFGDRVSFALQRDEDYLYSFRDEYKFTAGFGRDFTQVLFMATDTEGRLALFDPEGNLLDVQRRAFPKSDSGDYPRQEGAQAEAKKAWLEELGFQSATIKVKRFGFTDWARINDFDDGWSEVFDRPNDPESDTAWRWLDGWLVDGKFAWGSGVGACWINHRGEVTDT